MPKYPNSNAVEAPRGFSHSLRTVFLLCLLSVLTAGPATAIDQNCNFRQNLADGITYYVYNPNYPNRYFGEHSCRWVAASNYRVRLSCTLVDLPPSRNCTTDRLAISIGKDIVHTHCGSDWFVEESFGNEMTIDFRSSYFSQGSFLCQLQALEPANENCQCGWKKPTRIVGGVDTGVNEYPMMAGLVDTERRMLYCGATIISHKHVVTAAHCLNDHDIATLGVVVGEHDVSTGSDTNATRLFRVAKKMVHPQYRPRESAYDIAVLRVDGTIEFSNEVGPVCLPFQHAKDSFVGSECTVLGWGTTEFGGPKSDVLQKANLYIISNGDCRQTYPEVSDNEVCTYRRGKDTCQFDSGGPLLYMNSLTRRLVLTAVTSVGIGCADDTPALNTKIGPHLGWVMTVTEDVQYCMRE